jgi:tetratricopeptide (TPR) repeat protein
MDARMACLAGRRGELAALVEVLGTADAEVVGKAVEAVHRLGSLADCADAVAVAERARPPREPEARRRHDDLAARLARVRAMLDAGRVSEAAPLAEDVAREASALGYRPLEGEAHYELSRVHDARGEVVAAEATLHRAYLAAEAGRDRLLKVRVAERFALLVGDRLGRVGDGERWADYAAAVLEAGEPRPDLESYLLHVRGVLANRQGRFDEAIGYLRDSLAAAERAHGVDSFEAGQVNLTLSLAYTERGDYEEALAHSARDIEITTAMHGERHPAVALSHNNRALIFMALGQRDEAVAELERSIEIWEENFGPDYPRLAMPLHNLGDLAAVAGEHAAAQAYFERALALWERGYGAEHPDLAHPLAGLADALAQQQRFDEARPHLERAIALQRKAHGEDHPLAISLTAALAELELNAGNVATSLDILEQAAARLDAARSGRRELGVIRFGLAQALWSHGRERPRATSLADLAREDFEADGARSRKDLGEVLEWLAARD